jgi:hypothetical protein
MPKRLGYVTREKLKRVRREHKTPVGVDVAAELEARTPGELLVELSEFIVRRNALPLSKRERK